MEHIETRRFFRIGAVFAGILAAVLILRQFRTPDPITKSGFFLNTFISVTLYDSDNEEILDNALQICRDYENQLSKSIEASEIYKINHRTPSEEVFTLTPSTAELIGKGLHYCEISDGAYDITIEPLSTLWNFSAGLEIVPEPAEIEAAAKRVNWKNLSLSGDELTLLTDDVAIDLGSIAKGFIADEMKDYLMSAGVKKAIINLGGNVLCIGSHKKNRPFVIGIQDPFDPAKVIFELNIDDKSVVTSGVYERHFIKDGINYHHILNPKDGYPYQNGLVSVTIISDLSIDGDGLSTTCFSLGLDKGMELIEATPDIEAFFITEDGEIHPTSGAGSFLN